jgi:hypothetical protein
VKEAPIEHVREGRGPHHGNQERPLAKRNQPIDRQFLPKLRRGLK